MVLYYGLTLMHSDPVAGSYGTVHRRSTTVRGRIDVPGTALIMEQLLIMEQIDLATFADSFPGACSANYIPVVSLNKFYVAHKQYV
jgi:hypothetical protein